MKTLIKNRDIVHILILLTIAFCIGIYLLITTVLIAKDGVTFIKYAQELETNPIKTITAQAQHPGYPWLIWMAHKLVGLFCENTSVFNWIYCAQSTTLLLKLFALILFYFVGKKLVGAKSSFWAILILIILPQPAHYGSDALSDWPHLAFLAIGLLILLTGALNKKPWIFGFAGLVGGIGYLVRPECVQLIISGILWLGLQLFLSKRLISRGRIFAAICLLLAGFLAIAVPYMKLKRAVFPKKNTYQLAEKIQPQQNSIKNRKIIFEEQYSPEPAFLSGFTFCNIAKAFYKLCENITGMLMWFFVPVTLIGLFKWFKEEGGWYEPEIFCITFLILLNISVMIWLYCKYGYMSDRHNLVLLIVLVFYVPLGLCSFAEWCMCQISKFTKLSFVAKLNCKSWFLILVLVGFFICAPKLFRPIRTDKKCYRATAIWLAENTAGTDIIAVPDIRISFYAQRNGAVYEHGCILPDTDYIVRIFKTTENKVIPVWPFKTVYDCVDKKEKTNIVVYKIDN